MDDEQIMEMTALMFKMMATVGGVSDDGTTVTMTATTKTTIATITTPKSKTV